MKKKLITGVLLATTAVTAFAGCGASGKKVDPKKGKVYLLNFKPETDKAWQNLAKKYQDEKGVEVKVLTAADGKYNDTLKSEMAKSSAPTIFNIGNAAAAKTWDDYTVDLKDSAIYKHLTDKSLVVNYNDKVAAVANCFESFGLIYNKTMLEAYTKLDGAKISSVDDIKDQATLIAVADDIQKRVEELKKQPGCENLTEAFASAGLDDGSSWRFSGHLANMPLYYEFKDDGVTDTTAGEATITGKYLDNYKAIWDMYVNDSAADKGTLTSGSFNAEQEFGMGQAVFYQNGDWEYANLVTNGADNGYVLTDKDVSMMPIYMGIDDANEGLACGTENHWAVNAKASKKDQKATLDFLEWVITSDDGRDAMTNTMGLTCPFDTFTGKYETKNGFAKVATKMMADGKETVQWAFNATPNVDDWRKDVVSALTAYTDGSGSWDGVKTAFVDGWATQWKLANE